LSVNVIIPGKIFSLIDEKPAFHFFIHPLNALFLHIYRKA